MNIKVSEKMQEILKNVKLTLMKGAVIGTIALSGSAATTAYAQDNNVATEAEFNDDINLSDVGIENEIKRGIPIGGYKVDDGKMYDIGVGHPDFLEENVEYIYDLYMVDDKDNIIKKVYEDVPFGTVAVVKDEGRYYAVFKEKETKKVYGVTGTIDTISMKVGSGYVGSEYEYYGELHDYLRGELTLRDATHTGGATSFLYDAIARGISMETGLDFEEVRDAIINLNLNTIAGTDPEQLDILFQDEVNYTKLEENTDIVLSSLVHREYFGLNNLAGDYLDHDVLLELDNIYNLVSTTNKDYIVPNDYVELKNTLDFFLSNGEINGHKFEELTDGGKRLALVSYERIKIMVNSKYNSYDDINEIPSELSELYQITKSMDVLSVATILNSTNLLTYEFNREAIAPVGVVLFDINNNYFDRILKRYDESVPSFAGKTDKLKSVLFVNNFNSLNLSPIMDCFGQNIDIHSEFANMEEYLNAVLEHNSTHSVKEHVSLVDTLTEHDNDKLSVAYLESFYKVIKYELETEQLNEKHVSAILRWVLEYYNGFYIDNPGTELKYTEHLSNGGMLMVNNLLNQYKVLLKNVKVNNNEINVLIEEVNKINLWQETKAAEQIIYSDFEVLQERLNYYTIVKGDTLWKIAQRYNMSAQELYDLNRDTIDNPNLIYPGQKIKTNLSYDYEEQFRK